RAAVVPDDHSLRMAPGRGAVGAAPAHPGVALELVVPDHEVKVTGVGFLEGGANRILERRAHASASFLQLPVFAAGEHELLSDGIGAWRAAERACAVLDPFAARKPGCIELEYEPPLDRPVGCKQRLGSA